MKNKINIICHCEKPKAMRQSKPRSLHFVRNDVFYLLLLTSYLLLCGFGNPLISKNSSANKLYKDGKIDEALNVYRDAQSEAPESPELHYNIGNILHKKERYKEAADEYNKALLSDNINLQADTYYNIGNSLYRQNKLLKAIEQYKKTLDLRPDDEDAKYNIEFIRRKLKQNAQQQQQQTRQQNQSKQQKKEEQNQKNQKQQQSKGSQSQQGQEDKNQKQQKQEEQAQQQDKEQGQEKQDKQAEEQSQEEQQQQADNAAKQTEEKQQQAQEQPASLTKQTKGMSKEDAQRILDAFADDEKKQMRPKQKQYGYGKGRIDKDW